MWTDGRQSLLHLSTSYQHTHRHPPQLLSYNPHAGRDRGAGVEMTKVSQERVSIFSQLDGNILSGGAGFTDTVLVHIVFTVHHQDRSRQRVHIRYLRITAVWRSPADSLQHSLSYFSGTLLTNTKFVSIRTSFDLKFSLRDTHLFHNTHCVRQKKVIRVISHHLKWLYFSNEHTESWSTLKLMWP